MNNVKVVLNKEGVRELLKSQAIMSVCLKEAKEIASKNNEKCEISSFVGKNRVNVSVIQKSKSKNNNLLKAVGK